MKFIELTAKDGSKFLANIDHVTEIYDMKDSGSRLYFNSGTGDNQVHASASESYKEIKALIN